MYRLVRDRMVSVWQSRIVKSCLGSQWIGLERQYWKVKDSLVMHRCVADWQSRLGKSRNVGALIGLHGQSRIGK